MAQPTSPIDIASSRTKRQSPVSPGQQHASNLTSALQQAGTNTANGGPSHTPGDPRAPFGHFQPPGGGAMSFGLKTGTSLRRDSFGNMNGLHWGSGSKPISMAGGTSANMRKESLAGSLMGGMSWGGISVGSWIRDDVMMSGTSPFAMQSPSFHSSSYLPKLEANFMRDFSCCGFTLPTLHDLLQHYEEAHAHKTPPTPQVQNQQRADSHLSVPHGVRSGAQTPRSVPAAPQSRGIPGNAALLSPRPRDLHPAMTAAQGARIGPGGGGGGVSADVDEDMDMEMDDPLSDTSTAAMPQFGQQTPQGHQHQHNQQANVNLTPLNLSMLHHQQQHTSIPNPQLNHLRWQTSTPGTAQNAPRNNPTVSSVNTPTLLSQNSSQFRGTPDSSDPGTPRGEPDETLVTSADLSSPMPGNVTTAAGNAFTGFGGQGVTAGPDASTHGLPVSRDMLDLCIDEPAKRLFSPAVFHAPQQPQTPTASTQDQPPSGTASPAPSGQGKQPGSTNILFRLGTSQYGPNSEIAQRIREQQLRAGVPDTTLGLLNEEPKPFRCPVIGCEKAYKNQNGLKYHKAHGHNNQQLHDNADGTFSIVNPETCTPYPGTLGMEKEKPFRCDVCGKRYKNLNGLKYHRSHSPPCNPDLQQLVAATAAAGGVGGAGLSLAGGVMRGQNINVAGAGLPGIGEEVL